MTAITLFDDPLLSQSSDPRPERRIAFFRQVGAASRHAPRNSGDLMAGPSTTTPAAGVLESLSNDLAGAVDRAGQSVVAIHARRRIPASGVHWRPGIIVAAHHTLQRDEEITVSLADGSTTAATLAGRDPSTDLAVLKVDEAKVPVASFADSSGIRVGALVLALGRPGTSVTASMGVISAVGGEWRTWHGGSIDHFVRLDISIYDGFSGGPLIDAGGRVLGLNTSGLSRGAALAIPVTTVNRVVDQLLTSGRVSRGYLGLGMQAVRLPAAIVERLALPNDIGLLIVSAEPGGPADRAGVLIGDILIAVGGTAATDPSEILALLGGDQIGKEVEMKIIRAGEPKTVTITVGERPREARGHRRGR
jgi:S1-C subfamily serine protease